MSRRPRARSAASSAPPKTLWSVTAIAPRPCASAWSSSSSTSIEQSCDQLVCRWRSATTSRASRAAAAWCAASAACDPRRRSPLRGRRAPLWSATSLLRDSRRRGARGSFVLDHPRGLGGGEFGLLGAPGRSNDRDAGRLRLGDEARQPSAAGTKIAACAEQLGAGRSGARGAHPHPPTQPRETPGREAGIRVRSSTSSQSGCCVSSRTSARRSGRSVCRHSITTSFRFPAGANNSGSIAVRYELVAAGETHRRRFRDLFVRREKRVDAREQPLALGARRWVAEPLGREERRGRERGRIAEREVREARQSRLEAVHDVEPAAGERERRGSRGRRPARPSGCGGRSARPGRSRSAPRSSSVPRSARRPAARSRARFEGARMVTAWPRRRSSRASPSTCSFTSCGCDQANGVTSAIRTSIESSAPAPSRARAASRAAGRRRSRRALAGQPLRDPRPGD